MELRRMIFRQMKNEGGFVLVGALLILVLLIVIGIAATTSTVMEIQIAGSDRTHKDTFYAADGGTQVASELIEQSIWDFPSSALPEAPTPLGAALYISPGSGANLFMQTDLKSDGTKIVSTRSDLTTVTRDAYFNYGVADPTGTTEPRTDIWVGGHTVPPPGGSLQQLAGYEGEGKGQGSSGQMLYEIHSLYHGINNSESWIVIEWLHVM